MAAPRSKKTTVVKKKPPVKKTPKIVFREVAPEPKKKIVFKTTKPNKLEKLVNKGAAERRLPVQEVSPKRLTVSQPEKVRMNVMDKLLRQGTPNRAVTPRVINQGYTPGSASRAVVPSTTTSASAKIAAGSKTFAFLGSVARGSGILGAIVDPIASAAPAGTGSTVPGQAQRAVEKKMKREIRQGPKLAVTGVKEGTTRRLAPTGSRKPAPGANYTPKKASGFGKRISEGAKFERLRASRAALGSKSSDSAGSPFSSGKGNASLPKAKSTYSGYGDFKMPKASMSGGGVNNPSGKSSGDALRRAGAGTYTASYDVKAKKSGTSKAASVTPAAGSSGTSQATKKKSRSPTKYQRNELAMEQRKSSSGKPKKSIFSLFRKG